MGRCIQLVILLVLVLFTISAAAHGGSDDHDDEGSSSSADKPDLRDRSLIVVKIWCLILVFIGTFIGGISPYFLKWNEGFLVLGTQFAGGIFLATALMHFLSDSNETFGDLTTIQYPFSFMLASAGYLLTMLADFIISYVYGKQQHPSSNPNLGPTTDVVEVSIQTGKVSDNQSTPPPSRAQGHDEHFVKAPVSYAASLGDSILLIFALCFHSVFEGIAIGVAETKADAWKALWTVSLHKIFAAIAMGIALLRMIPDRPLLSCVAYAFSFAISSPIGVAIGIIIDATTQGAVADWIFAISMGLACGVFIYVSINHLLSKGYIPLKLVSVDTPHYKFLAVLFGVGVIAVVMIWDT